MTDSTRDLDLFSLDGQVFVVTRASGGIGVEIARGLGARVGLDGRRPDILSEQVGQIPNSFALSFDVTDEEAAADALDDTVSRYGRINGIVCNAASRDRRPLGTVETSDFRILLEANLVAPFHLARQAARHMITHKRGRIIMMTSLAGDFAMPGDVAYPSTKARLSGLVPSLAVDLGQHGITVNGIASGAVATEVNLPLIKKPEWQDMIRRCVPLKRWAQPSELAGAVVFLASDASSCINGQILTVDGGASVRLFPMD